MTCQEALKLLLDSARFIAKGEKVIYGGHTSWVIDRDTSEDVDGRIIMIDEKFYQELRKELDSQKTFAEMAREKK